MKRLVIAFVVLLVLVISSSGCGDLGTSGSSSGSGAGDGPGLRFGDKSDLGGGVFGNPLISFFVTLEDILVEVTGRKEVLTNFDTETINSFTTLLTWGDKEGEENYYRLMHFGCDVLISANVLDEVMNYCLKNVLGQLSIDDEKVSHPVNLTPYQAEFFWINEDHTCSYLNVAFENTSGTPVIVDPGQLSGEFSGSSSYGSSPASNPAPWSTYQRATGTPPPEKSPSLYDHISVVTVDVRNVRCGKLFENYPWLTISWLLIDKIGDEAAHPEVVKIPYIDK